MLDRGFYMSGAKAFPPAYVGEVSRAILASPLLAKNPLNRYFETTFGFSVVFHREALAEVTERFPAFAPYLARALSPMANTFYLNPLVIPAGGTVQRHADFSLRSYYPEAEPPAFVSVLYVALPPDLRGGRLRLFLPDDRVVAEIVPEVNTLLLFRGDLRHDVTPVEAAEPGLAGARISLVCEQYCLTAHDKAQVPRLTVQSTGGFGALLSLETGVEPPGS